MYSIYFGLILYNISSSIWKPTNIYTIIATMSYVAQIRI